MKVSAVFLLIVLSAMVVPDVLTVPPQNYVVLKADFHVHTSASDGWYSPTRVVAIYKSFGYDVVAITDHNTMKGVAEAQAAGLVYNVTVIPGEELSFYWPNTGSYSYKHVVALFLSRNIYNSAWNYNMVLQPMFDAIHAQGGYGIVAHPQTVSYGNNGPRLQWDAVRVVSPSWIDGWEYSDQRNVPTVPGYNQWLVDSDYTAVFDHDYHYNNGTLGTRFTLVLAHENSVAGVKEALLAHRTLVSVDGVIYGDQWVKDLYQSIVNPEPKPYTVTLSDGTMNYTISLSNSTELMGLVQYLRAGNYTVTP